MLDRARRLAAAAALALGACGFFDETLGSDTRDYGATLTDLGLPHDAPPPPDGGRHDMRATRYDGGPDARIDTCAFHGCQGRAANGCYCDSLCAVRVPRDCCHDVCSACGYGCEGADAGP